MVSKCPYNILRSRTSRPELGGKQTHVVDTFLWTCLAILLNEFISRMYFGMQTIVSVSHFQDHSTPNMQPST